MARIEPWYIAMKMKDVVLEYQRAIHIPTSNDQFHRQMKAVDRCAKQIVDIFNEKESDADE